MDYEALIKFSNPPPVPVEVADVGTVYIRQPTPLLRSRNQKILDEYKDDEVGMRVGRQLAVLLCDKDGKPLCDAKNDEAVEKLAELPEQLWHTVLRVWSELGEKGLKT